MPATCLLNELMKKRLLLLPVLCLAAGLAVAQSQLYKIVGPDGKVTFSDKPPADANGKISVLKSNVLRPIEGTTLPSFPSPSSLASAKSATASSVAASAPGYATSAELDQALLVVMGMVEITRKVEPMCSTAAPASAKRLALGIRNWGQRNATFIEQQKRILMEVITPAKRAGLQARLASKTEQAVVELNSLSPEGRVKWCERLIANLSSDENDIANVPAVSVPLITNRPR
jgi:hypothetical protein